MPAPGVVRHRGGDWIDVGSVAWRAVDTPLGFALGSTVRPLGSTVRLRAIARPFALGMGSVARWRGLSRGTLERGCVVPRMLHCGARLWFAIGKPDTCRLGSYAARRAHDVPKHLGVQFGRHKRLYGRHTAEPAGKCLTASPIAS